MSATSTPTLSLHRFPRTPLLEGVTPIQHLPRLSALFPGVDIYVKRDDVTGLGGGGNKLRKLEFLMGEALAQGADTIVTVGARQSNHARLTAAAAAKLGLACELVLTRTVPIAGDDYILNGNVLLDALLGAHVHDLPAGSDAMAFALQRAEALQAQGRKVYVAPLGGSSPVGCLGYAAAAEEIAQQEQALGLRFDRIALPNGSGGTHAGLVAGLVAMGQDARRVVSHTVLAPLEASLETTCTKAQQALDLIQPGTKLDRDVVQVRGGQLGAGYGLPTDGMREALSLLGAKEGLLLDPAYSGKAMSGLISDLRANALPQGSKVLFIMTGGAPALYAYRAQLV